MESFISFLPYLYIHATEDNTHSFLLRCGNSMRGWVELAGLSWLGLALFDFLPYLYIHVTEDTHSVFTFTVCKRIRLLIEGSVDDLTTIQ